jgi:hypothetical protein
MQVPIPAKKYPGINFFELLIGPRGSTQKRIEQETGTKLSIRGPGVGPGDRTQLPSPNLADELHVHITGETEEAVTQVRTCFTVSYRSCSFKPLCSGFWGMVKCQCVSLRRKENKLHYGVRTYMSCVWPGKVQIWKAEKGFSEEGDDGKQIPGMG